MWVLCCVLLGGMMVKWVGGSSWCCAVVLGEMGEWRGGVSVVLCFVGWDGWVTRWGECCAVFCWVGWVGSEVG